MTDRRHVLARLLRVHSPTLGELGECPCRRCRDDRRRHEIAEAVRVASQSVSASPVPRAGRYPVVWDPKGLREHLCVQQAVAPDPPTRATIGDLIDLLDLHRPLGPDGKHGERHTLTCGCDNAPVSLVCLTCGEHGQSDDREYLADHPEPDCRVVTDQPSPT